MFENANTAIVKITKGCNLRCKYCYIENKDEFDGKFMSFEDFKQLVKRIIEDKKYKPSHRFSFIFHGGEPLTAGYDRLKKMLEYSEMMFHLNGIKVNYGIQSNLTLLNPKMIRLLNRYGIGIGASFDGFGKSNLVRLGDKLNKKMVLEDKIRLIQENDGELGVLSVVTPTNYKTIIKDSNKLLKKYKSAGNVKINRVENVLSTTTDGEVMGIDLFNYVHKPVIQDFMKQKNYEGYSVHTNMEGLLSKYFSYTVALHENIGEKTNCYTHFCSGGTGIVEVEPNGDVFYCGRYKKDYEEAFIRNIYDKDLFNLHTIKRWADRMIVDYDAKQELGCFNCRARDICDGGCQAFYYSKFEKWGIRDDLVCDLFQNSYDLLESYGAKAFINIAKYFMTNKGNRDSYKFSSGGALKIRGYYSEKLQEHGISLSIENKNVALKGLREQKKEVNDNTPAPGKYKDHVDTVR